MTSAHYSVKVSCTIFNHKFSTISIIRYVINRKEGETVKERKKERYREGGRDKKERERERKREREK